MSTWSRWRNQTTAVTAVGLCVSAYLDGPRHVIALALPVTFLVAIAHAVALESCRPRTIARMCSSVVRVALCATSVLACLSLVARWHSGLVMLMLLVLVGSTPPVLSALTRRIGGTAPSRGGTPDRVGESGRLPALTDRELRQAWGATSDALEKQTDVCRCAAVVVTRQHLLDEIWSRDRVALEAWVAAGADDGTVRYFDASRRRP